MVVNTYDHIGCSRKAHQWLCSDDSDPHLIPLASPGFGALVCDYDPTVQPLSAGVESDTGLEHPEPI